MPGARPAESKKSYVVATQANEMALRLRPSIVAIVPGGPAYRISIDSPLKGACAGTDERRDARQYRVAMQYHNR
jgi:hypothetical protein